MLRIGLIGSVVTGICCFTPLLIWVFGAFGLMSVLPWVDKFLLTFFGFFLGLLILSALVALKARMRRNG